MGEHAEMLLSGEVNYMGEYTGNYHDNSFSYGYKPNKSITEVSKLIKTIASLYGKKVRWDTRYKIIIEYDLLDFEGKKNCTQICKHICSGPDKTNWNRFKKYLKERFKDANQETNR